MSKVAKAASIDDASVNDLKASFRGEIIRPADTSYDEHRKVWNGSIDRHPELIARCTGVADVLAAVRFARKHELLTAVRGGGHSFPGLSVCDGGIVIDLGPMKGIRGDPEARTVRAQAGVLLGELDRETQAFGLTIDNLQSVDLVTADGEFVKASDKENPGLFWGVRGGGGNFGIVTEFEFRLNPLGPQVMAGPVFWPMGGAVARVGESDTAFNGRNAGFTFNINGNSESAEGFKAEREWARAYWSALGPYHTSVYVNFLMEEGEDRIRQAFSNFSNTAAAGDAARERLSGHADRLPDPQGRAVQYFAPALGRPKKSSRSSWFEPNAGTAGPILDGPNEVVERSAGACSKRLGTIPPRSAAWWNGGILDRSPLRRTCGCSGRFANCTRCAAPAESSPTKGCGRPDRHPPPGTAPPALRARP